MKDLKQSSTAQPLVFFMALASDGKSPATGLTPTVTLSKNGGAFASPAGAVTEIANGWYKVAGNATDTNTLGPLILHAAVATADNTDKEFSVVAYDPQDPVRMGQTALPNAAAAATGGLIILGANTGTTTLSGPVTMTGGFVANAITGTLTLVTTATNLTNAPTAGDFTATMKTSITTAATAATPSVTVSDKTGFSLTVTPPTAVQNRQEMDSNSVGLAAIYARQGAPAGASMSADVAAVKVDTAAIKLKTDNLPASPAAVGSAMTLTSGERTAVADALLDRNMATGTDSGGRTPRNALRFLRNKISLSDVPGVLTVYMEDDATTAWSADLGTTSDTTSIVSIDPG